MKVRKPPERDTSKFALTALRWGTLGNAALCALAIVFGTWPDAVADGNLLNGILPIVAAAVVAFGLGAGWHFILGVAAHAESEEPHKKALAACLGVVLCAVGLATSGWYLASKIGGPSAVLSYQLGYMERLKEAAATVAANGAAEQGLIAGFEVGANTARASASSEDATGFHTGGKIGKGSVYESLMLLAGSLTNTTGTLRAAETDRSEHLTRAAHDFAEATKAAAALNAVQFEQAVNHAASEIAAAGNIRLTDIAAGFGGGLVVATKARPVVDDVANSIKKAVARADENRRPLSVPVYVPVTARDAVRSNPPPLAWIAAGVIEFLPLIGLAILLLLWRERHDHDDDSGAIFTPVFPPTARARPTLRPAE
jgi:hypothetical protein